MKEVSLYWDKLKDLLVHIDWQQFHFLRPKALYLFVPLTVIVLLLLIGNKGKFKWMSVVSKPLRKYMFRKGSPWSIILPLLLFIIGMSAMILGLAGPAWKKKEIPGEKIQAVVLIALDLSKSMLSTDIQPNRLDRAKFKINDFLDANPRARAGLVAFAGTAHPVLPFTQDYKIIKFHASSLVNRVMPVQGSSIEMLLKQVNDMMKNVGAPSTVFLLTDAVDSQDAALLSNWVDQSVHRMEIIVVSSPGGGLIPGYKVLSKQDPAVIQNLSQNSKVTVTPLTLDKSDVDGVARRIAAKLEFQKEKKTDEKEWDDMGWLLIIPAALITAFWFRRGWVIQWCFIPLLICAGFTSCGVKSKHPDWWYSKDYQGRLFEDAGDFGEAAERYRDDSHKAVAYYKTGNFEAAADLFALDSTAAGQYNRGLALSRLGRYDDADSAFNKAILLDPSLAEKINKTIEKSHEAKKRTDSVMRYSGTSVSKNVNSLREKKKKNDPLKERKAQSEDEELSADTRVKNLPKSGNRVTDEVASNIRRAKEASKPDLTKPANRNEQLAGNILLRRAEADPVEFLHKRFLLQERHSSYKVKKSKNPW
ncbi:VWA domain-containing protein [Pedobacter sp. HMF7647]|uniref:VWA domain-containing protein n=1 Tax=Hufsiella arboris TaxID=2695275 RepID=A0A7K1YF71_9SPHI|nr:VWA domain-containing protein [Hufsiella arboris]MXV53246.1 VWA domain-containing protein [Hufsiella arboris]